MTDFHRPTRAFVDLAAWRHNLAFVRQKVGERSAIMAVVKANGYGHGMTAFAREALRWGVQALAVATVDEAVGLRETEGFDKCPILLLGPSFPEDAEALQRAQISVAAGTLPLLRQHLSIARRLEQPARLHLKIDTGMGRYGFQPEQLTFLDLFASRPENLEGLMTHFAVSDSTAREHVEYTEWQCERFERVVERVRAARLAPIVHAANSGAVLHHPRAHYQMVRPGMMLYGANPEPAEGQLPLRQVMTLATKVVAIYHHEAGDSISYARAYTMPREGRIAILPIGYGDGFPRSMGNRAHVLINGHRVPVVGRVCMDQTLVDVTDFGDIQVGDDAVLYGSQGGERVSLEEAATCAGTIPYEITCQLGRRVPRSVVDSDAGENAL
ncbi:MAG: alanine racemase [Candidatus Sumerlaeota bacterium]|nr:alanine racemase [Candidatus Sumerlaeota bacterium]